MDGISISDIASIVSITLALIAIALSIVFYAMSTKYSVATNKAAEGLKKNVDRLEELFTMVLKSQTEMLNKTWDSVLTGDAWKSDPKTEAMITQISGIKAEKEIEQMKRKFEDEMRVLISKGSHTEIVNKAIEQQEIIRRVDEDKKQETLQEFIESFVVSESQNGVVKAGNIVQHFMRDSSVDEIVSIINTLIDSGRLHTNDTQLHADALIFPAS